jgi:hypothetical protein
VKAYFEEENETEIVQDGAKDFRCRSNVSINAMHWRRSHEAILSRKSLAPAYTTKGLPLSKNYVSILVHEELRVRFRNSFAEGSNEELVFHMYQICQKKNTYMV